MKKREGKCIKVYQAVMNKVEEPKEYESLGLSF